MRLPLRYNYDGHYRTDPDVVSDFDLEVISSIERYIELTERLLDVVDPGDSLLRETDGDTRGASHVDNETV